MSFIAFASSVVYLIHHNTLFQYLIFDFGSFLPKDADVNLVDLVKNFQTSVYYLLTKFGFDTAENEPLKVGGP